MFAEWSIWIIGIGAATVAVGIALAYGAIQSGIARRRQTPAEKHRRDVETHKNYDKIEET